MSVNVFQTVISNGGGGYKSGIPNFSYTGQYQLLDDGNGDWRIKFLTSGVLTFMDAGEYLVDIFLVGGGGNGAFTPAYPCSSGGGGGYTLTELAQVLTGGTEYTVTVGAATGSTSFGPYSVPGGANSIAKYNSAGVTQATGGNGGSGGAALYGDHNPIISGGKDGANGNTRVGTSSQTAGLGQGTTTREFGEPGRELYSNGGSSAYKASAVPSYTKTNMGHGGHGVPEAALQAGQPGVVIIRNHRVVTA